MMYPALYNLHEELLYPPVVAGRLQSVYGRVANACFAAEGHAERMVSFLLPELAMVPDGMHCPGEMLDYLQTMPLHAPVSIRRNAVYFTEHMYILLDRSVSCTPSLCCDLSGHRAFRESFLELSKIQGTGISLLSAMTEKRIADGLGLLCRSIFENDARLCWTAFEQTLGIGRGLTPSSDDAMVGVMAIFSMVGLGLPDGLARERTADMFAARTTDVSTKYLRCAAEGRFSQVICEVTEGLAQKEHLSKAVYRLAGVGSTSGMDTLHGMMVALNFIEQKRELL